jgi:hypothetical protein
VEFYPFPTRLSPEADVEARISGGNLEDSNLSKLFVGEKWLCIPSSKVIDVALTRSSGTKQPSRYLESSCTIFA